MHIIYVLKCMIVCCLGFILANFFEDHTIKKIIKKLNMIFIAQVD